MVALGRMAARGKVVVAGVGLRMLAAAAPAVAAVVPAAKEVMAEAAVSDCSWSLRWPAWKRLKSRPARVEPAAQPVQEALVQLEASEAARLLAAVAVGLEARVARAEPELAERGVSL